MNSINNYTTINGNQRNIFNGKPIKALNPTRDKPCISPATLSTSTNYIDRPAISAEIASKMQKSCGSKTLVHALALIGLGGTGKTQLVCRYIEQHQKRYDTILWLDVRDEITTTSSFKRCCDALSIAFDKRLSDGLLHDAPAVQKLLEWLAAREKEQKWLVVLDNADELENLAQIIPHNALAGSVIITSHDADAAKLLLRAKCTNVDKMELDECKALLARSMEIDLSNASLDVRISLGMLAIRLDGIPLALDLAGARIWDDIDNSPHGDDSDAEGDVIHAIEQYLVDLEEHAKSMLSDPDHIAVKTYKKTIWSVWETVLSSLKNSEQRDPGSVGCTMHLLKLAVVLGPPIVHHEIFRAASQSFVAVSGWLKTDVTVPPWFKALLQVKSTGVWDSHTYRKSITRLERFNLVRRAFDNVSSPKRSVFETHPTLVSWPGYTIHDLVRWCTGVQTPQAEYDVCREILVTACSRTWNKCNDGIDFRHALFDYMQPLSEPRDMPFTQTGIANFCTTFGATNLSLCEIHAAECCLVGACNRKPFLFGESAPETLEAEVERGRFYLLCALVQVEPEKRNEGMEEADEVLGRILEHPEGEIRVAAASWDLMLLGPQLPGLAERGRIDCLFRSLDSTDEEYEALRIDEVNKTYDELSTTVIPKQLQALRDGLQRFGPHHHVVNTLRFNLVHIYGYFGKSQLAKKHLEDLLACEQQSLGQFDERRIQTMEMLAICQLRTGDPEAAKTTMREAYELSRTTLNRHDPRTRLRKRHLQKLDNGEWKDMLHPGYRDVMVDESSQSKKEA